MEKALTKVGGFWVSKKAREEISNITEDLSIDWTVPFFRNANQNITLGDQTTAEEVLNCFLFQAFSTTVEEKAKWVFNKLKGKPAKSLPDLLREHNLPAGLFPRNITCHEYEESRSELIVYLASACEVSFKDSSIIRYTTRVKGTLTRGKLSGIEGMKTKVLVWVKVNSVTVESCKSDKVCFTAGVKKSRPKDAYEITRDAVKIQEF